LPDLDQLRRFAREIFDYALASVNPREAVLRAIVDGGSYLDVCGERVDVSATPVLAIALGKAATSMALGLEDAIGDKLARGVISAPASSSKSLSQRWEIFAGGHPLPNEDSLEAAEAAFNLLDWANDVQGFVIFLVSGGGSAMMEYPSNPAISLGDLRRANELLVSCGARIDEINAVRRTFSAIKGGRLAEYAARARIVTLIVSDTNHGDEANVASGPTLSPAGDIDPRDVIERYKLDLPKSIPLSVKSTVAPGSHYVLLDNSTALEAAREKAGPRTVIAHDIGEQSIEEGCKLLLRENADCVISGGEFSCPVRGDGRGGRNLETVLRLALMDQSVVALSAGTDGIDGNSPAAGAIADPTTLARAGNLGLDPHDFLARSDSYSFFEKLNDLMVTGPTGTNVRDLRILLKT
jgi:hydroxypyruvate reductase